MANLTVTAYPSDVSKTEYKIAQREVTALILGIKLRDSKGAVKAVEQLLVKRIDAASYLVTYNKKSCKFTLNLEKGFIISNTDGSDLRKIQSGKKAGEPNPQFDVWLDVFWAVGKDWEESELLDVSFAGACPLFLLACIAGSHLKYGKSTDGIALDFSKKLTLKDWQNAFSNHAYLATNSKANEAIALLAASKTRAGKFDELLPIDLKIEVNESKSDKPSEQIVEAKAIEITDDSEPTQQPQIIEQDLTPVDNASLTANFEAKQAEIEQALSQTVELPNKSKQKNRA